jgi:hypothetical protein
MLPFLLLLKAAGTSVYGVSSGQSTQLEYCYNTHASPADTRTDDTLSLGNALLQHQQSGVLPSTAKPLEALPLLDPIASTSMPESWVRGTMLIRMNSLIRGHSGVRWELIEKMGELLRENLTPMVPLHGSISASGGQHSPTLVDLGLILPYMFRSFSVAIYRLVPLSETHQYRNSTDHAPFASVSSTTKSARCKTLLGSGISKLARRASVGGVIGGKVFMPGTPAMTLPELLKQTEVELVTPVKS